MQTPANTNSQPVPAVVGLLNQICQQIIECVGATSCSLSQWDQVHGTVTTEISYVPQPELELPLQIATGDTYPLRDYPSTARVLTERLPISVQIDDPLADPSERAYLKESAQKSLLMLPLMIEEEAIGLLEVYDRDAARHFTSDEIGRISPLTAQAAVVIEGGYLFAQARREARDMAALLDAGGAILSSLELDKVLRAVAEQMVQLVGVDGSTLSEYDAPSNLFRTWVEYTSDQGTIWKWDSPDSAYSLQDYPLTARVLRERITAIVQVDEPGVDVNEQALLFEHGQKSLLMLPIIAYNRVIGLVKLTSSTGRHDFTTREVTLAQALTNQAATAIENARLYKQVQQQVEDLHRSSDTQARLLEMVRAVSNPVLPVHDHVLVLPLIGVIDSERARQFTDRMLETVRQQRAKVVVVDVTGVPIVDTTVATAIIQAAEATHLLGAEVVLAGIRAEVAQTLVTLGLSLEGLTTRANLQASIEYALGQLGQQIVSS